MIYVDRTVVRKIFCSMINMWGEEKLILGEISDWKLYVSLGCG